MNGGNPQVRCNRDLFWVRLSSINGHRLEMVINRSFSDVCEVGTCGLRGLFSLQKNIYIKQ